MVVDTTVATRTITSIGNEAVITLEWASFTTTSDRLGTFGVNTELNNAIVL
jgi:hypothetical protein